MNCDQAILRFDNLTATQIRSHAQHPFILTQPVRSWPTYRDWSIPALLLTYGDTVFRAEAVDWTFKEYFDYMRNNHDESPLYLFDPEFAEKMQLNLDEHNGPSSELAYTSPKVSRMSRGFSL